MKRKNPLIIFFGIVLSQSISINNSIASSDPLIIEKSDDVEISHEASELYNMGEIEMFSKKGTGIFKDAVKGFLSVNPNSTISIHLVDKNNNTVVAYQYLDGKRLEDSRKVISYFGNMYVFDHADIAIPKFHSHSKIQIHDYQFAKHINHLEYLVSISVQIEFQDDPNNAKHTINLFAIPNKNKL